ncbi:MAG TPA: thioredoxin domain-containing protein [Gaiellaceae bacterium]|nr:thioredoxin domain-containing protein [Gaiellaceae bacterium]
MPSGKKSRELRRTQVKTPPPVRSTGARGRQASPRALLIGGVVVFLIVLGIGLAFAFSGGGGGGGLPKNAQPVGSLQTALPGAADVNQLFKGIPQNGTTLGWPFARATLVEYIDLQCPVCQEFETTEMPAIIQKYVRTKKLKIVVKPWAFIGNDSFRAQAVMLAAAKQNKAFNFAQVLYDNQGTENTGWLTDNELYQIAVSVPGMQIHKLFADRTSSSVKHEASHIAADAQAQNVTGTPGIFVGPSAGTQKLFTIGLPDQTKLFAAIDAALAS